MEINDDVILSDQNEAMDQKGELIVTFYMTEVNTLWIGSI